MVDFFRRHPVLFNLLLMAITSVILLMLAMRGLNIWTGHGKVQVVPDVSGMSLKEAMVTLQRCNLHAEVIDSVHNDQASRGSVVDQVPPAGDKVKPGRDIYLTINAFTKKQLTIPDLTGSSARQAMSVLRSLGFNDVTIEIVPSDYKDLVLGVKSMGVSLRAGTQVPADARLTVEVGSGISGGFEESDTLSALDNTEWEQTEFFE